MPTLVILKKQPVTAEICIFTLGPETGPGLQPHTAGAHINVDLGELGTRSYSLIDWPISGEWTAEWTIAVKREDGGLGGSKAMHALQPGQILQASEPINDFALNRGALDHSNAPVLLLAGGIGITPLISMATALQASGREFSLHYSGRDAANMGFVDLLTSHFGAHLRVYTDDAAPLSMAQIFTNPAVDLYICGPKGMIDAARSAAVTAGLNEAKIHVELFTTAQPETGNSAFEVEIHDTGQVVQIPADKTIIEALEDAGLDLMYDCQRGDCGICQTDVISGTPDHRDVILTEAERASGTTMQICVSRAKSARLVLDL